MLSVTVPYPSLRCGTSPSSRSCLKNAVVTLTVSTVEDAAAPAALPSLMVRPEMPPYHNRMLKPDAVPRWMARPRAGH